MQTATIDDSPATFRALAVRVREAGLLDHRRVYYGVTIGLTIAVFIAGWAGFVIVGNSWATLGIGVFLGLMFTQLGFLGHDAGHQQVFASRQANRLLGLIVGNTLIGLSFGWWVPKHSAHHAHPNEVGRDPDIGDGLVVVSSKDGDGQRGLGIPQLLARWQAPLFFPLMILRSGGLHVFGIRTLLRQRDRAAFAELALIALHAAVYLTLVLWVLSPLKALVFILIQQTVFSIYLGCSFAPNHKGMLIIEDGADMSFARRQVVTARNVSGGRLITLMFGGLNYQIEHHLFSSMPRPNLRRAQGLVREFCMATDLGYCEETLVGSFRRIIRYLRAAAATDALAPLGAA